MDTQKFSYMSKSPGILQITNHRSPNDIVSVCFFLYSGDMFGLRLET